MRNLKLLFARLSYALSRFCGAGIDQHSTSWIVSLLHYIRVLYTRQFRVLWIVFAIWVQWCNRLGLRAWGLCVGWAGNDRDEGRTWRLVHRCRRRVDESVVLVSACAAEGWALASRNYISFFKELINSASINCLNEFHDFRGVTNYWGPVLLLIWALCRHSNLLYSRPRLGLSLYCNFRLAVVYSLFSSDETPCFCWEARLLVSVSSIMAPNVSTSLWVYIIAWVWNCRW